ncbi:MAG: hypothetical protein P4L59_21630 [Desulfosporosinus sp.]|nr:hypothetical protein [Desulfosporosinus sp.]
MTVTCAYRSNINKIVLSQEYDSTRKLASLNALNNFISLNLELINRPFLCEAGLVSSLHQGTVQYARTIRKHNTPLWLASQNLRGTIDFYYSKFEWPFQICLHPNGFLDDFVIDRIKNGFIVPLFTRQITKSNNFITEAHKILQGNHENKSESVPKVTVFLWLESKSLYRRTVKN